MLFVPLGEFKVAYWQPENARTLCSQMFLTEDDAQAFAESLGLPFLLMRARGIDAQGGAYEWEVLPTGSSRLWTAGTTLHRWRWPLAALGALLLLRAR